MIANFTEWNGSVEIITFQMTAKNMNATGEYSIAGFKELDYDYTYAPSTSFAPSSHPTNLEEEQIAYIVSYAGKVRTVIKYPFQIDSTGEVLAMNGTQEYQLCEVDEVDEVEGRKAEVSMPTWTLLLFGSFNRQANSSYALLFSPSKTVSKQNEFLHRRKL
jgi:hypothetical protein